MSPERWQKIKSVFDAALEIEPSKRGKFLDKTCADDPDLRGEVQKLIESFEKAPDFIEQPAANEVASLILEPKETLKEGQRFAHYKILRQIGAGGMGEVYLADDEKLDRSVAIKILNEQFSRHESNVQRFIREAKAASSLNHPNILVIHEISVGDDANYIVSEYVEGKTLREIIGESSLKVSEILEIAIQISGALVAAHGAHIVHRDIKPENIVVRPDGYVKVLDFGLAKLLESKGPFVDGEKETAIQNQTAQGVIMGTVNYMSPEQAKGERVDVRTDIFSLGVVIYELATGRTPFAGNSMSETFANLINVEPKLSHYASNVQDELQRIVSKMLQKNSDERYQTVKGVLADLKDLRENLSFDERLEKSTSPNDEEATAFMHRTTGVVGNISDKTQFSFLQQIRRYKPLTALVLLLLLAGSVGLGYYFLYPTKTSSNLNARKSLAVLPFVNASQDPNAEYLSDGITESIINDLSRIAGLRVMSRNSSFRFKNNQTDARAIASQLGVETLVTGDIKQIGDRLVINIRLIDGSDDSQIWGNQYVKASTDIIAAQNEIAQAVAQNLRLKLTSSEQQRLGKNHTENVEAYQLYLKGKYHTSKLRTPETMIGISYFQQAIGIDPNYALAYAGLSQAYLTLPLAGEMSPTEFFPKAKTAAQKAMEIAPDSAEVRVLGNLAFWADWDWESAEIGCRRSIELDPDNADARFACAHLLSNTGRHPEALMQAKLSRELDPLNLRIRALEGQFLLHAGQVDEALVSLQKTSELEPTFWLAHLFTSSAYIEKGMYPEAVAAADQAVKFSGGSSQAKAFRAYALAKWGKLSEARSVLAELLAASEQRYIPPYHIAQIYQGLEEREKTLEYLERAFELRDPKMVFLKVEPKWNNLRSEPRFIELMKRMNFE